jgi:hypothetical protein
MYPKIVFTGGTQDYQAALEQARQVNLEFAERLPNFVADEHAIRYKSCPECLEKTR